MVQDLDIALFNIEQDLMDLEEKVRRINPELANKILTIVDKVKELQNG